MLLRFGVSRSLLTIGLAGLALAAQAGGAEAQAQGGLAGFFARLFAPQPYAAPYYYQPRPRNVLRPRRTHLAGLPGAVPDKLQEAKRGKPVVREPDPDPVGKLMHDRTLRRGDIVILPGGARVFRGSAGGTHHPSDFEDVRWSRLVGEKTRRDLMAMTRMQPSTGSVAAKVSPAPVALSATEADDRVTVTGSLPRRVGP
jgi:hypothetical protein